MARDLLAVEAVGVVAAVAAARIAGIAAAPLAGDAAVAHPVPSEAGGVAVVARTCYQQRFGLRAIHSLPLPNVAALGACGRLVRWANTPAKRVRSPLPLAWGCLSRTADCGAHQHLD